MGTETDITKFNVRVYGILIREDSVLVSDELIQNQSITKFPGGGLEFNESSRECLVREFQEELNQSIRVGDHLYTTDQFIRSAFRPWEQVICIYYFVHLIGETQFKSSTSRFDFDLTKEGDQESFRWCKIDALVEGDFAFLSDSTVVSMLKQKYA